MSLAFTLGMEIRKAVAPDLPVFVRHSPAEDKVVRKSLGPRALPYGLLVGSGVVTVVEKTGVVTVVEKRIHDERPH